MGKRTIERNLTEGNVAEQLIKFALPFMLSNLIQSLYNVADMLIVGNYSGTAGNPVGVHLHFSIVKDDGSGGYTNEYEIQNTLDPSPYFGLNLNADNDPVLPLVCGN